MRDDMKNRISETGSTGIGFGGILFIVFLVLKLTDVIDWRWIWVCSPLWIPFTVFIGATILIIMIMAALGILH